MLSNISLLFTFFLLPGRRQMPLCNVAVVSVAQLCLTVCDPMDCCMPGLHVLHHLPSLPKLMSIESSEMPSNPLSPLSPSPLPSSFSIRVFSNVMQCYICFSGLNLKHHSSNESIILYISFSGNKVGTHTQYI